MTQSDIAKYNILDKADLSQADHPQGRGQISKIEKYGWVSGAEEGVHTKLPKQDLNIDIRYQREEISKKKVLDIARAWSWLAFGTISVIYRKGVNGSDSTYWVFDGGHRTRAAFLRDDIKMLPAMVHRLEDVSEEAKAFIARNTLTSNVSAYDRFNAKVTANEHIPVVTNRVLEEFGLQLVKGGHNGSQYFSAIGALQQCVSVDEPETRRVLRFCQELAGDSCVTGKVLESMFLIQRHFRDRDIDVINKYGHKIRRHSQKEIEVKMNQFATLAGKGGVVTFAKAILELINHRTRRKLMW